VTFNDFKELNRAIADEKDAKTSGDYIQRANHHARFVRH
jgi:hypothetical protein